MPQTSKMNVYFPLILVTIHMSSRRHICNVKKCPNSSLTAKLPQQSRNVSQFAGRRTGIAHSDGLNTDNPANKYFLSFVVLLFSSGSSGYYLYCVIAASFQISNHISLILPFDARHCNFWQGCAIRHKDHLSLSLRANIMSEHACDLMEGREFELVTINCLPMAKESNFARLLVIYAWNLWLEA
jgi:hypothetical protein